jgi:hypothetical protein
MREEMRGVEGEEEREEKRGRRSEGGDEREEKKSGER